MGLKKEGDTEKKKQNMLGMLGDDAAHRQTAPTGHCLLCLRLGPLFRSLLTSWPSVRERERMGGFKMTDTA